MYTEFHGNPSSSCQHISLQSQNVNLLLELEEKSDEFSKLCPLDTMNVCVYNFMAIHQVVDEIFQTGPKQWTHC